MFFTFNQNNSGGSFIVNDSVCEFVIIEATDSEEANYIATRKGIYFDGVSKGRDCDCCGDRWYEVCNDDGEEIPLICGESPHKYKYWSGENTVFCRVFYKNGVVEEHRVKSS